MTNDLRLASFLSSMGDVLPEELLRLEEEALAGNVPIIKKETQRLLKVLLKIKQPQAILEIGTGVGFSALLMATFAERLTELTTIENYPPRIEAAKKHFSENAFGGKINFLQGDALDLLSGLPEAHYDFVFLDAAKGQYPVLLPELTRVLTPGGLLVTDNVLQEGTVLDSRFAVTRRDRTIHARMRSFLQTILTDETYTTTVLPVGDGVAVSVKGTKND